MLGALALLTVRAQDNSRDALKERFALRGALAAGFAESYVTSLVSAEREGAERHLAGSAVDPAAFQSVVESFEFEAAALLDDRGRAIQVWPRAPQQIGKPLALEHAHLRAAVEGRIGISTVVPSAVRQSAVVAFATPFQTEHGQRVLSGTLAMTQTPISDYIRNVVPIGGSILYIVDSGVVVLPASWAGVSTLAASDSALATAAARGVRGSYDRRGSQWYFTSALVPGTSWRVIAAVPEKELLASVSGVSMILPWLLFAAFAIAALGVLALILRVIHDRARLAAANAALSARNDELHELDRLKDEFVALVSHELRTPLTSIIGYVRLLLRGRAGEVPAEHRRLLQIVERNSHRLVGLVGDLLFAAKADAGKLTLEQEVVALDRIVRDVVESVTVVAREKNIELEVDADSDVFAFADPARLAQLLDNLTSNAVKFTPEGGQVSMRLKADATSAVIEVEDSGIGIPEDELRHLFERFFRASTATEREIQGTGLGLSVAKTIVELHGGTIEVDSRVGQGTRVRVQLPLSAAPAIAA